MSRSRTTHSIAVVKARGRTFRRCRDSDTSRSSPVLSHQLNAGNLARRPLRRPHADLSRERDLAASVQQRQLQRIRLDVVGNDGVCEHDARGDHFDQFLQHRLADVLKVGGVRHGRDRGVSVRGEDASVGVVALGDGRADRERVGGLAANKLGGDLFVEGAGRGLEEAVVVRLGANGNCFREVRCGMCQ